MSKITLQTVSNFQNDESAVAAFNANMAAIQTALDLLLSRDGTSPNTMLANLDMNSKRILNLPTPETDNEPVIQAQLSALVLAATSGDITPGSIIEVDFANGAVSSRALATDAVTTVKITDLNVTSGKLADGAVVTAKIGDQQVTFAKLPNIANNTVLGNLSGSTASPSAVTVADLASALLAGNASLVPTGAILPYSVTKAPSSWLICDGSAVSRTTYSTLFNTLCPSATVTFDTGSNQVIWTSHPFVVNDRVVFTTSGSLPSGMTASTTYYVKSVVDANTFTLASSVGGPTLTMSGTPTGVHTGRAVGHGLGNGSSTFNVPDLRGEFLRGYDFSRGIDTGRYIGSFQDHQLEDHTHTFPFTSASVPGYAYPVSGTAAGTQTTSVPASGNHGTETRSRNVAVSFIIKV